MDFERPPVYFDIETGPLPRAEVEMFLPEFEKPKNYKDEAKIAEALAKKESEWFKKAALAATTGKVLAVGYCTDENDITVLEGEEASILTAFWNAVTYAARSCKSSSASTRIRSTYRFWSAVRGNSAFPFQNPFSKFRTGASA